MVGEPAPVATLDRGELGSVQLEAPELCAVGDVLLAVTEECRSLVEGNPKTVASKVFINVLCYVTKVAVHFEPKSSPSVSSSAKSSGKDIAS